MQKQGFVKRLRKELGCDQPSPLTVALAFLPFCFPRALGVLGG
jgi:hypothetical protein